MAVLAAAALLDELMGRNRNIAPNEKGRELNWEDPEVRKIYSENFLASIQGYVSLCSMSMQNISSLSSVVLQVLPGEILPPRSLR